MRQLWIDSENQKLPKTATSNLYGQSATTYESSLYTTATCIIIYKYVIWVTNSYLLPNIDDNLI